MSIKFKLPIRLISMALTILMIVQIVPMQIVPMQVFAKSAENPQIGEQIQEIQSTEQKGIKISKNIKVLSPDKLYHNTNGGTLIKIGKSFRVDVNSQSLLHMHFPGRFSSTHFSVGIIGSGIYGGLRR